MRLKSIFAVLILATVLTAPASALVLGLTWGVGQSPVTFNYFGADHTVYAGSLKGYFGGQLGNPLPPNDGTYFGDLFCVDLAHSITIPTEYEVESLPISALANGERLAWLYRNYADVAKNDSGIASALQLALWDIATDGGDGLDGGNFRYMSGASSKTQSSIMITESLGKSAEAIYLRAIGPYGQSVITRPIPEPGTFGLVGLGLTLVGLGFFRKRS